MTTASQRDVVVIARSRDDRDLFNQLLVQLGCRVGLCSEPSGITQRAATPRDGEVTTFATIICHRVCDGDVPRFDPEVLPGTRLLAYTDDVREEAVVGMLEQGAHQCFGLDESPLIMKTRLFAALREHRRTASQNLVVDDIVFDIVKRRVWRAGKPIDLSPKEHDLAYYLFKHRDRIVGNNELMTSVWSLPQGMDARRIDTAACRLRKKLGLRPEQGWHLKRLRTVGYRLLKVPNLHKDVELEETVQAAAKLDKPADKPKEQRNSDTQESRVRSRQPLATA